MTTKTQNPQPPLDIGVHLRWLQAYNPGFENQLRDFGRDLLLTGNGVAVASTVLVLGGLAMAALLGLRRSRVDVVTGVALALVLSATVVVFAASTPTFLTPTLDYGLRWTSPAGMFTWLALGWSLVVLLRPARWRAMPRLRGGVVNHPASASFMALVITAILAVGVATGPYTDADVFPWAYRPARTVASLVGARLPRQRSVLVRASTLIGGPFQTAIIYRLRRTGYRVVAPSDAFAANLSQRLGAYYSPGAVHSTPRRYDDVLFVDVRSGPVPRIGRVLARVPLHGAPRDPYVKNSNPPTTITVSVAPGP
jgi:hypothetical protein